MPGHDFEAPQPLRSISARAVALAYLVANLLRAAVHGESYVLQAALGLLHTDRDLVEGDRLRTVFGYREEAARCRAMAAREKNEKIKATIQRLCVQLEALADERERLLQSSGLR
jgi:hypothetical protein